MKFVDQTKLFETYEDQWVAMTDDHKVICSGTTLGEVIEEAKNKGYDNPITAKIPSLEYEFIL